MGTPGSTVSVDCGEKISYSSDLSSSELLELDFFLLLLQSEFERMGEYVRYGFLHMM